MDHSTLKRLDARHCTDTLLEGALIYDFDDNKVGRISRMHGYGYHAQVVADVGAFLGLSAKNVAIPMTALDVLHSADGTVYATTSWSRAQIEKLPGFWQH